MFAATYNASTSCNNEFCSTLPYVNCNRDANSREDYVWNFGAFVPRGDSKVIWRKRPYRRLPSAVGDFENFFINCFSRQRNFGTRTVRRRNEEWEDGERKTKHLGYLTRDSNNTVSRDPVMETRSDVLANISLLAPISKKSHRENRRNSPLKPFPLRLRIESRHTNDCWSFLSPISRIVLRTAVIHTGVGSEGLRKQCTRFRNTRAEYRSDLLRVCRNFFRNGFPLVNAFFFFIRAICGIPRNL